jgi:thiamine-monophosphate kinase
MRVPKELRLIKRIGRGHGPGGELALGIGDDAAILRGTGKLRVLTTDLLLEGTHFEHRWAGPRDLGWKALAVNLSDLAAMGATPGFVLLSLGLTAGQEGAWLNAFMQGFNAGCRRYAVRLAGGDLCRSARSTHIGVTAVGSCSAPRIKRRDGAKQGDCLVVVGSPGESACGLKLLRRRRHSGHLRLTRAHLRPLPRLAAGRLLGGRPEVGALTDVSDGLVLEAYNLCRSSKVGIEYEESRLPVGKALSAGALALRQEAKEFVLYGGEGYELLFSVRPAGLASVSRALARLPGSACQLIGRVIGQRGKVFLRKDGDRVPLAEKGFSHF